MNHISLDYDICHYMAWIYLNKTYALEFLLFNMHDQILKWKITIIHLSFHNNVLHIEWFLMNFDLAKGKET
jgi:hypothetical protein